MSVARTITFSPAPTVTRENITATEAAGTQGFQHLFNPANRPVYQFALEMGPLTRPQAETLSAQHAYHQGGKTFIWDGAQYGSMADYEFVALADGVRRDYFLPNRNIGANSFSVQTYRPTTAATSTWASAAYSLRGGTGLVTFGTAPYSGDYIRAKYGCVYRVKFPSEGIQLHQFRPGLYNAQLVLTEHPTLVASAGELQPTLFYQVVLAANVRMAPAIRERAPLWHVRLAALAKETPAIATTKFGTGNVYGSGLYGSGIYPGSAAQTFYQQTLAAQAINTAQMTAHAPIRHVTLAAGLRMSAAMTTSASTVIPAQPAGRGLFTILGRFGG